MVHGVRTLAEAKAALVAGWDCERRQRPEESRVMLASTRADVARPEPAGAERLQAAGELGADQVVQTERGERRSPGGPADVPAQRARARGEERHAGHGAERWRRRRAADGAAGRSPGGRTVAFDWRTMRTSTTATRRRCTRAQGVTVDRAHVLATGLMDRHAPMSG